MAVVNHAVEGKNGRQPRFHALVGSAESERLIGIQCSFTSHSVNPRLIVLTCPSSKVTPFAERRCSLARMRLSDRVDRLWEGT